MPMAVTTMGTTIGESIRAVTTSANGRRAAPDADRGERAEDGCKKCRAEADHEAVDDGSPPQERLRIVPDQRRVPARATSARWDRKRTGRR